MSHRRSIAWSGLTSLFWAGVWVLLDGQLTVGAIAFALLLRVVTSRMCAKKSLRSGTVELMSTAAARVLGADLGS